MRGPRVVQLVAGSAVIALAVFAIGSRDSIGFKGMPVSVDSIAFCFIFSALAAYIAARGWHWLPAPFIGGIVGVFAGGRLGPAGGLLGLLVGLAVTIAVVAESRLASCRR